VHGTRESPGVYYYVGGSSIDQDGGGNEDGCMLCSDGVGEDRREQSATRGLVQESFEDTGEIFCNDEEEQHHHHHAGTTEATTGSREESSVYWSSRKTCQYTGDSARDAASNGRKAAARQPLEEKSVVVISIACF
jgi:hypothetical protein